MSKHLLLFVISFLFAASNIASAAIASVEYFYAKDGTLIARKLNGSLQKYEYDRRGQLLAVKDAAGKDLERYVYDPTGNILSKTIAGRTTIYTYDKANQLVSSTCDGKTTKYEYDAAGRLIRDGDKTYRYGYLDKILEVQENGRQTAAFAYHVDGQIATAIHGADSEDFLWDGLALIHRGDNSFVNEPYVTGGNPILSSKQGVMFNDMLGNTLGMVSADTLTTVSMTAFGETTDQSAMFTGKPYIGELGYVFLFRNYRAGIGKWQTSDPLGYPDGWNNLAYVNNQVTSCLDIRGDNIFQVQDAKGAGGAGHAAWIAQKTNGQYHVVDYNPKGMGIRTGEFNTLQDALNFLNKDSSRYESYLEFNTTAEHCSKFKSYKPVFRCRSAGGRTCKFVSILCCSFRPFAQRNRS